MNTDGYRYGILGAGRQGTAAAYDLIVRGEAAAVTLADLDEAQARASAARVNELTGTQHATGIPLDATDPGALDDLLGTVDAVLSALPYALNLQVARAAVDSATHMCDLGGNTSIVMQELELDERAQAQGVCLIPDCGVAPGLTNNLVALAVTLLDETDDVFLFDGGIPVEPRPPWNYELTFHMEGLTNEYDAVTTWVKEGRRVEVQCLDPGEYELVEFDRPFGTLEAFPGNTISTLPWTVGKNLRTLKAKILRYPGHAAQFGAFKDLGLFSRESITVNGMEVIPRDVYHALIEPKIRATPDTRDLMIVRILCKGSKDGRVAEGIVELFVDYDEELGFTAMEKTTGCHAAIVLHLMVTGQIKAGATPVELAVTSQQLMEALSVRGMVPSLLSR